MKIIFNRDVTVKFGDSETCMISPTTFKNDSHILNVKQIEPSKWECSDILLENGSGLLDVQRDSFMVIE